MFFSQKFHNFDIEPKIPLQKIIAKIPKRDVGSGKYLII